MKKILFILFALSGAANLFAQDEVNTNENTNPPTYNIKQFGDFVLDMNLLAPPRVPSFSTNLLGPDATKDYNMLFQLPLQWIISSFAPRTYTYGLGTFSHTTPLQSSSFRLNDNMRINTYGQYRLDGSKIPNPSALPWEKNNFIGGMELKFNKNFGIRVEVQQGRNPSHLY